MFNTVIVQSCSAVSDSVKQPFDILGFSPVDSNIFNSFEGCFPFISLSVSHFLFSMWLIAGSSFWECQLYRRCSKYRRSLWQQEKEYWYMFRQNEECLNIYRIADVFVLCYMLTIWEVLPAYYKVNPGKVANVLITM